MSAGPVDRRTFLKIMGVTGGGLFVALPGCDRAVSLEEGAETVMSYVDPQDFVVPGREIWYASTCNQCPAGCGIHARVLEGRVRKLEGNPDSPINHGGLCAMGQAGLQHHYNPDRLRHPLARKDGQLAEISWDDARAKLKEAVGHALDRKGEGFALLTGEASGHLGELMQAFVLASGGRHFAFELLSSATAHAANQSVVNVLAPQLHLDKARLVVSFGADFIGTWQSPVHFSTQYARFRGHPRGALIQIEPKMSLTGANADWWLPIRAGTEGWLMLGVAKLLVQDPTFASRLPAPDVLEALEAYDVKAVSRETDVAVDQIERLARALTQRQPSLVLVGGPAESHEQGHRNIAAGWLLNQLLGNVGQTITTSALAAPHPELAGVPGSTAALRAFAEALPKLDTVFVYGANPLYAAADFFGLKEKLQRVSTKVIFATVPDETALAADLVIPVRSYLEDWGTRVPAYNPDPGTIHLQQPVMQPLYADVPSVGDLFLGFLRQTDERYAQWDDFYAYMRAAVERLRPEAAQGGIKPYKLPSFLEPPVLKPETPEQALPPNEIDRAYWEAVVAQGLLRLPVVAAPALTVTLHPLQLAAPSKDPAYPFDLIPSPRCGLYDGRHANLPWLQELPDQLTTVVWDSWAELHPETAAKLGIASGDIIEIASPDGRFEVKALLFPGIHPQAVAVPLGQGHEVGRYAKGVGVNPLRILSPRFDADTGELALYATHVQIRNTGRREPVVKLAPTDYQHGRRIVRTVSARHVGHTSQEG